MCVCTHTLLREVIHAFNLVPAFYFLVVITELYITHVITAQK